MVEKVAGKISGNSSYDYPNQKDGRKTPAIQAYENTPGKREAAKKKNAGAAASGGGFREAAQEQKGVILDLSPKGKRKTDKAQNTSFIDSLRKMVAPVIEWLKNFWGSQDNAAGEQAQQAADETGANGTAGMAGIIGMDGTAADSGLPGELPPLDEVNEIPDYEFMLEDAIKSRDLQKMEQLLTKNGDRRPARHSDLLTYYDRRGKLVEMDDTAKHRVLFGDKNIMKL